MESQISELKAQYESEKLEYERAIALDKQQEQAIEEERRILAKSRKYDSCSMGSDDDEEESNRNQMFKVLMKIAKFGI